ncbi:putative UDP-N-acetylmuramoylalanine--D-glutamate ligase [Magnetofaba australis IT-1]|uniref:UDP-N-acetylmuramoylalanine--D-glutamate ligase n=1 Tax=Magnetofaba australis IT-1 TaxID=1434232 RepID=A0A1Y2K8P9_9PROT|nr:putative UDP-N-acetylmuramoylalanine--D-glutamate ligase [Magnetofaba australis IT-1]
MAVIGLGRSGQAAARFLAELGENVLAWDERDNPDAATALIQIPGVSVKFEPLDAAVLKACAQIVLSPGVPRAHPAIAAAIAAGVAVINDVWLLQQHANAHAASGPPTFLGITGTNGKSTVTTLLGLMLEQYGLEVETGGNLGQAALTLWHELNTHYVLELSSYQLESLPGFRAQIGCLLNVAPDHMDRYADFDAYRAAKANIFAAQQAGDVAVINADDPACAPVWEQLKQGPATVIPFSARQAIPGGIYPMDHHMVDHRIPDKPKKFFDLSHLKIKGPHNLANAAAAAAMALSVGVDYPTIGSALEMFAGLPHRLEWVRNVDGVDFYNDSKGTNVAAVIEALQAFERNVVLIAGGVAKGGDFTPLRELLPGRVTQVIAIGKASDQIAEQLDGAAPIARAESLQAAIEQGRAALPRGGTVLLSPGCASFDMFNNFEHRGEAFRDAVQGLAPMEMAS